MNKLINAVFKLFYYYYLLNGPTSSQNLLRTMVNRTADDI